MRKVNKGNLKHGKLFHKVSVKLSSDELALRFIADQQKKIDEYERVIDDLFLLLRDPNHKVLLYFDDTKVKSIFAQIRELQENRQ